MMRLDDGISGLLRGGQRRASRKKRKRSKANGQSAGRRTESMTGGTQGLEAG